MMLFPFLFACAVAQFIATYNAQFKTADGALLCWNDVALPLVSKPGLPYASMAYLPTNSTVVTDYGMPNSTAAVLQILPQGVQVIFMKSGVVRRADFRQPMIVNLSMVNSADMNGDRINYIQADFYTVSGAFKSSFFLCLSSFNWTTPLTPVLKSLTMYGLTYLRTSTSRFVYAAIGTEFSGLLDLDIFVEESLASGLVLPSDQLRDVKLVREFSGGSGTSWTSLQTSFGNVEYRKPQNIGGLVFAREVAYLQPGSMEYCNFSGPTAPALQQVTFSYFYTSGLATDLKCSVYSKIGFYNGTNYTTSGVVDFPINIFNDYEFRSNFSLQHWPQLYPNGSYDSTPMRTAACFVLTTRTDYNSTAFTNPTSAPAREIFICPFWTPELTPQGTFVGNIDYFDVSSGSKISYSEYQSTNTKGSATWPAHYFYATSSVNQVTSFNKYFFVRLLRDRSTFNMSEVISGASFGMYIYSGYASFSNLQLDISSPVIPSYSLPNTQECYLYSTLEAGIPCKADSPFLKFIKTIIAIPNLVLFVRFRDALAFVDDFTYFSYHKAVQGPRFTAFCQLMWNITSVKWIPYGFQKQYSKVTRGFETVVGNGTRNNVPNEWLDLGESAYFFSNSQDYWLGSLPIIILTFLVLHYIGACLKNYPRVRKLFVGFRWFVFLLSPLLIDNIQNFAFRVGQQYRSLVPRSCVEFLNLVFAHSLLSLLVMAAFFQYILLYRCVGPHITVIWDMYMPCRRTVYYMMVLLGMKFCTGMAHSALYDWPLLQISVLASSQLINLLAGIRFRDIFCSKFTYCLLISEYVIRVVLYMFLCVQTAVGRTHPALVYCLDSILMSMLTWITMVICLRIILLYATDKQAVWARLLFRRENRMPRTAIKPTSAMTKEGHTVLTTSRFHIKKVKIQTILKLHDPLQVRSERFKSQTTVTDPTAKEPTMVR